MVVGISVDIVARIFVNMYAIRTKMGLTFSENHMVVRFASVHLML